MKRILTIVVLICSVGLFLVGGGLDADTKTAQATMSVTVPAYLTVELGVEDSWGVPSSRAGAIQFTAIDSEFDQDMFAPTREEGEYSWHFTNIVTSLPNWTITAALTTPPSGPGGSLNNIEVGWDGAYRSIQNQEEGELLIAANEDDPGTPTSEYWQAFPISRGTSAAGNIKCYYRYHVNISGFQAGTYSGGIVTFTVTTS